jgi:steroid delta-isomerase-like uncharacterized protein
MHRSSIVYWILSLALPATLPACAGSVAPAAHSTTPPPSNAMSSRASTEATRAVITRLYDLINRGELAPIAELVADDFIGATGQRGSAAFVAGFTALRAAFPDLHYTLEAMVAEDNRVAVRWTWTGTHQAPFRALAATGRSITSTGMAIFEVAGGKITATSLQTDRLGFLQALGAIPYDPAFGTPPPASSSLGK